MHLSKRLNIEIFPISRVLHYGMIILSHIAVIYLAINSQWTSLLISLGLSYLISQVGVSFMYHRVLSHNAVKVPKAVELLCTFIAGLSLQGSSIGWVATHNLHHAFTGTTKDPHSPGQSHWLSIQLFGYTFRDVNGRYARRLLRNKMQVFFHKYYWSIYLPIFTLPFLVLDVNTVLSYLWAPVAITWQLQSLVNTWSHSWGKDDDRTIDTIWLFPFVLGDCWHKSHHDHPSAIRFNKYDPMGWLWEKLFK